MIQEDYFRNIFNTVREAILILDGNMRVLSANRSFFTTFKVDADNTIGSLLYSLGNRQWDIATLRILLEEILPNNDTVDDYEIEHDFENIGHKIMLLNACKIVEKETSLPIILLAIEDITERKQLEALLTESEERYRRIFDTASDGIVLLEKRAGHIVHANPAAENMLGYSAEEYAGKMLEDIGVPIDMSDFPKIMAALNRNGILNYYDVAVTTKSGSSIDADIYLVDRAQTAQCNIRDVSERKRKEEALRDSQQILEGVINAISVRVFWKDRNLVFLGCNAAFAHDAGFAEPQDVIGKDDYQMGWSDQAELYRSDDRRVIESGCCKHLIEESQTTPSGDTITLLTSKLPLLSASGEIIGVLGTYMDITEHKKLEAQLLHSQKMEAVGTLAGGIAHDFNNILNVIIGYGYLLQGKLATGSQEQEQLTQILIAADRAATLTKRLLVFSRKQAVAVNPVNINALILGLQKFLIRIFKENIEFRLDLAESPLIVLADAGQIEQVLMNLAVNARDAMPDGGRLTISTELLAVDQAFIAAYGYGKPGKYALITVSDTGQGMDAETRKKIFEPFFTTKGIGEGTGLGLSISYGIIKQHDGYINVYSEPGHGTALKIYLPLSEDAALPDFRAEEPDAVKGGNETVLIAEDDASLRQLSRIVLEAYGYTVIIAGDGEEAITKFMENRERIGLVMLDMIMPKKSGKEVCAAIRKVTPEIKILITSGYALDVFKTEELTECGADFISKPFLPTVFLKKVREVLDR